MAGLARVWILFSAFAMVASLACAQDSAASLKGRPILNVDGLFSATHRGIRRVSGEEVCQVVITVDQCDLTGILPENVAEADSWWLWRGSQDPDGAIHPKERALPHHPIHASLAKNKAVVLDVDPVSMGLHNGDRLLVFLQAERVATDGVEQIVLNDRGLNLTVIRPKEANSYQLRGFSYSPDEELEDGRSVPAVHFGASLDVPNVSVNSYNSVRYHLAVDGLASTAPTDLGANTSATVYVEKLPALDRLSTNLHLAPFVGLESSESLNDQAWIIGIQAITRIRGTEFGAGTAFNSVRDAMLVIDPIEYQDWYRRTELNDILLIHPDFLVTLATVRWEPIFLFSRKEVPDIDEDYSLHLGAAGWYFLKTELQTGRGQMHTVGRFDIELQVPFVHLGLQKLIPFKARLTLAIGSGAVPGDGYVSVTSYSIGVKTSF